MNLLSLCSSKKICPRFLVQFHQLGETLLANCPKTFPEFPVSLIPAARRKWLTRWRVITDGIPSIQTSSTRKIWTKLRVTTHTRSGFPNKLGKVKVGLCNKRGSLNSIIWSKTACFTVPIIENGINDYGILIIAWWSADRPICGNVLTVAARSNCPALMSLAVQSKSEALGHTYHAHRHNLKPRLEHLKQGQSPRTVH